jgi:eukaryotic-like serine/threonine-protein kinase
MRARISGESLERLRQRWREFRPPPRVRWLARAAVGVGILAAVAFFSAILTIQLAIRGRDVDVPAVAERTLEEARADLEKLGLGLRVADRIYSQLPTGRIVRQRPAPGTAVKTGQHVHVVVSLGTRDTPTPLLEGRTLRAARFELLRAGLQLGQVSAAHLPGQDPDRVVLQEPPPNVRHTGSPRVNLLVSLGPREQAYVMPDLAGLPWTEVERRLRQAGLLRGDIRWRATTAQPRGIVLDHRPARGERVPAGAVVDLEVADFRLPRDVLELPRE